MSASIPAAGTYLVIAGGQFASNASGSRSLLGSSSSTVSSAGRYPVTIGANPNTVTRIQFVDLITYAAAGNYYLHAAQSSGAALAVQPYMRIIRLR